MEIESSSSPTSSRPVDLDAICRLCLSDRKDSLKAIFDEILGPNRLPHKIELLLQLQISKHDKLSTMVCNDCIIRLDTWFAYKKQCHRNQQKLVEWSNVSKSQGNDPHHSQIQIKQEPLEPGVNHALLPVKVEIEYEEEMFSDSGGPSYAADVSNEQPLLEDMDLDMTEETEDERRCPDCGKIFGSAQNRRRHESMVHMKRDRRYQMAELKTLEEPVEDVEEEPPATTDTDQDNKPPAAEKDENKIKFAAGLRLVQKDAAAPIDSEPLSKIELSYIEKCKAMISMFKTLQCACHNVQHKTMRNLLSHLRETRIWFPLFTCYNCMVSLTDRSTFTKHHSKCPRPQFETLIKLTNLKKRSEIKTRLYQNFKCNRCQFLFSFHEDFCRHLDEEHVQESAPFYCSCRSVFESLDEYKAHCYSSCVLSYYCDICFVSTTNIEDFVKHCQEKHDHSEGFVLLQDTNYIPRNYPIRHKEADDEANVIEGKRERRKSAKEPVLVQIYDKEVPPDPKDIPTRVIKQMLNVDPANMHKPASCPLCQKRYSNVNNMVRHYRVHLEKGEVEVPKLDDEGEHEDLYTCPDCGGVYPSSTWKQHIVEKHSIKTCTECDKEFQFQTELEQHRKIHLNLKVFKDSKTQAYRTESMDLFTCQECDAAFSTEDDLTGHTKEAHPVREEVNVDLLTPLSEELISNGDTQAHCDECDKPFASHKSLREHVLNKHGSAFLKKNTYPKKCTKCEKVCTTGAAYAGHMQMHIRSEANSSALDKGEFPKKCEYCDKMCNTGAGLYLHTQMHERVTLGELKKTQDDDDDVNGEEDAEEDESYHTCKRCFKVFATRTGLKEHMKSHGMHSSGSNKTALKNRKVLCDLCHVALDSYDELETHKQEEHDVTYSCDICSFTSKSRREFKTHKEFHLKLKSKLLNCKFCKVTFKTTNELAKHLHTEHNESAKPKFRRDKADRNPFKCHVCRKGFATFNAMTTHTGWHKRGANAHSKLGKKPKLLKKQHTTQPKQEPIDIPEFQCSTCLVELPNETALQIHMLEQHGDLDDSMLVPRCETCNKDFDSQDEYEKHKRLHVFLERQQKHLKTPVIQSVESVAETSPKKYPCSWCKSAFSRQDTLTGHIKNHHREHAQTEFECDQCSRVFDKQSSLTMHLKVHQKQKTTMVTQQKSVPAVMSPPPAPLSGKVYVCSLCSMSFSQPKDLRTHTINAHPF